MEEKWEFLKGGVADSEGYPLTKMHAGTSL